MQHRILMLAALLAVSTAARAASSDTTERTDAHGSPLGLALQVRSGQTLSGIFARHGLSAQTLAFLSATAEHAAQLHRLRPGDRLEFELDDKGVLDRLVLRADAEHVYTYRRTASGFSSQLDTNILRPQLAEARGVIGDNLYEAARAAGLSNALVAALAGVFEWDVDLSRDLRRGARFTVIYQQLYLHGRKVRDGHVLAAELINRGRTYRAVRYEDPQGRVGYFTPQGRSVQKAFLRSPVEFAQVSSAFSAARRHPLLHKVRAHRGVDYAAPSGTPIRATADGAVRFQGRKGGFGRALILSHGGQRSTVYAHLSRFAAQIHEGARVRQGQVIGYVGSSGLATGPHLHYEFRVDGIHQDPLSVELPRADPVPIALRENFVQRTAAIASRLDGVQTLTIAAR